MTCTRCGCPLSVHEHYHRGTYCGRCGPEICPAARAPSMLQQLRTLFRRRPRREWEIKVTTPDGTLVDVDTEQLAVLWQQYPHTNDGFVSTLHWNGLRIWVKPAGWVEPDRAAALDGTAALPERYQRR